MKNHMKNLYLLFFLILTASVTFAQGTWTAVGCTAADPKVSKVFINSCYDPEGYNEFSYLQTGSTPWNWSNFNVTGSGANYNTLPNSGLPNNSPVANVFTANTAIVAQLNGGVGTCPTQVFFPAPNPIPANSAIMVTMSSVGIAGLFPGSISALCGKGPVYVISGNYTSGGNGNFGFFRNSPPCAGAPATWGCNPSAVFNFGNGCAKTLTYNLNNMTNQEGENFLEDGTQNVSGCFDAPPCAAPPSPILSPLNLTFCAGQNTIPGNQTVACSNCTVSTPGFYNVFTAATGGVPVFVGPNFPSGFNIAGLPTGTTTFYVTQTGFCESARVPITLTKSPGPTNAMVKVDANCPVAPGTGSATVNVSSAPSPYTYIWSNGGNTQTISSLLPGTYTVTVTDANTCTKESTITVGSPPDLTMNVSATTAATCVTPGTATVSTTGGTPSFTYVWSAAGGNGATISTLTPGTYTATATDSKGCTKTIQATIAPNTSIPTAIATAPNVLTCTNPTIAISGTGSSSGGYTYNWSGPNVVSNGTTLNPTVGQIGTYTITVTNTADGCTKAASVTVGEDKAQPVTAIATPPKITCANTSIQLNAGGSGAGTYNWSGPGIVSGGNTKTPTVNQPGTYTITVTSATNGCTKTESVTVLEDKVAPSASAGPDKTLNCLNNQNTTLTASGGGTYAWSNGGGSATTNVNAPGTYTVTVTNPLNGCTKSSSVNVTTDIIPPTINPIPVVTINCNSPNAPVSVTASGPNLQYNWSNGGSGNSSQVNSAGTYNVVVTNGNNGCTATQSFTAVEDKTPPIAVLAPPLQLTCSTGGSIVLDPTGSSSGANFSYLWFGPTGSILGSNQSGLTVTTPGNYLLSIANNINGCTKSTSVNVVGNVTPPTGDAGPPKALNCYNSSSVSIGTLGSGNQTYSWSSGSTPSSNTQTITTAGVYTLTITNLDNGCTKITSVTVTDDKIAPVISPIPPVTVNCFTPTPSLNTTTTGSNLVYTWTPSGSGANPTITQGGTYTVVVTNSVNGCTDTKMIVVPEDKNDPLAVVATPPELNCYNNSSIALDPTGTSTGTNFNYNWSGPSFSSTNLIPPNVTTAGIYTLLVTNSTNGCTKDKSVTFTQNTTLPTALAGNPQTLNCFNLGTVNIGGASSSGANFTYLWSNNVTTATQNVTTPGTYSIVVTNTTNGCTKDASVVISEDKNIPTIDAGIDLFINCYNPNVSPAAVAGNGSPLTYSWTGTAAIGSGANTLTPSFNLAGTYTVTVTNSSNGCTNTDVLGITSDIVAPTAVATVSNGIDCNNSTAVIDATGSSSGANFTYGWTGPSGFNNNTINPTVTVGGVYNVTVTNTINGCTKAAPITVLEDKTPPAANAGGVQSVTCTNPTIQLNGTGSVGSNFSYNWTTVDGNIVVGTSSLTPTINQAGTYVLVVTNNTTGCTASSTAVVNENKVFPVANATGGGGVITCFAPTLPLGVNVTSGANLQYQWTATGGGNIIGNAAQQNITVNQGGIYNVTITNAVNGCSTASSATITSNNTYPTANATASGIIDCNNPNATLDGTSSSQGADFSYNWTGPSGFNNNSSLQPTVTAGGAYTINITNTANGCISSKTIIVNEDKILPVATLATPGQLNCISSSVTIQGTGSSNNLYNWTTSNGNIVSGQNTLTPTVNQAGLYTLNVINPTNGCQANYNTTIISNILYPIVTIAPPNPITCFSPNVTLDATGSSSGGSYQIQWFALSGSISGGGNTLQPFTNQAGTYTLNIKDNSNGCQSVKTVNVVDNRVYPTAIVGANAFEINCNNPQVTLTGAGSSASPTISYQWNASNGGTFIAGQNINLLDVNVNKGGTFTLVVTNTANACSSSQSIAIAENTTKPFVNAGPAKIITCTNTTVQLQGDGSPGGQYTSQWSNSGGNIPFANGGTTYTPTVSQVGTYTLTITNTQTGCTASATTNVTLDQGVPTANAGLQKEINCTVNSVQLDGTGSTSGAGLTFAWTTTNGNFVSGQNTLTPTVNKFGIYKLKVTNTSNNCTNEASVEVKDNTIKPTIKIAKPKLLNCANPNFTLLGTGSSVGSDFSYQWTTTGGNILSGDTTLIISIDKAGVYNLKIKNKQNACEKDSSVTVLDNFNKPNPAAAPTDLLTCIKPTVILDASASTNIQNAKIQWIAPVPNAIISGGNTLKPSVNEDGDYKLILTDTLSQCKDSIIFKVIKDANIPQANAGKTDELNCTKKILKLIATASASATITYQWTTIGGNFTSATDILTPDIDKPGQYTLKVSDSANQCVKESSVTITQDTVKPKIAIVKPKILDCKTTVLSLDASASSQGKTLKLTWTPAAPFVSGGNSLTPLLNKPGLYTLTIKDTVSTCTTTKDVLVEQDIVKPQAGIAKTDTLNCKNLSVKLKGTASSNSTFYNYAWKTPSSAFVKDSTTLFPTVNKAGNYQLIVTDTVNHCATTAQITIIKDVLTPIVDAGAGGNITCTVKEISLNGTATNGGNNLTYLWTTPNGNVLGSATVLNAKADSPGKYFLEVENKVNFCKAIDSTTVTQDASVPIVSIVSGGNLDCKTTTLVLDASGSTQGPGILFTWTAKNGGNIVSGQNTLTPTINGAGIYTLEINNTNNNCIKQIEKTILIDTIKPLINVSQDIITCSKPTTELTGKVFSATKYSLNWTTTTGGIVSTKTDTLAIVVSKKGIYTLKVKNIDNECEAVKEVKVIEDKTPPVVDCGPSLEINCQDSVLTLQGDKSSKGVDFIYTWTSNIANNTIIGDKTLTPKIDKAGAYYLLIVNKGNGCQGKDTIDIKINKTIPQITTLKPDTLTCKKQQVTVSANSTATGKPAFTWTSGANTNILSSDKTQDKINVNRPGIYSIAVIDDKNKCKSSANITVVQDTIAPTANAGANIELNCKNPTVDVDGQATGKNLIYTWTTTNGNIVANGNKAKVTVKSAGLYDFLVTNSFNGCTANDQMEVTFLGAPKAIVLAPEKLNCTRETVILDSKGSDTGTIYTYSWSDTNGGVLGTDASLSVTQPGIYNFKVLNTTNDCEQKTQVKIEQDIVNPTADAGTASTISCEKGYTILNGNQSSTGAKYAYKWTGGIIESGTTTTSPKVTAQATYTLLVTNTDNGCTATDSVGVISLKPAILTAQTKDPLCNGGKGQIEFKSVVGGTPPFSYSINGGKSFLPYTIFNNLKPGDYTAIVQDSKGCEDSTVLTINNTEKLTIKLDGITSVKIGEDVQIQATVTPIIPPLKKITWTPDSLLSCNDCLNPIVTLPKKSIYYQVKVVNENGCEAEAYTTVEVNRKIAVYVPSSFSPNGDNINDRFIAFGDLDLVLKIKWMRVYDRWGETVFEETDLNPNDTSKGWDGSFRGDQMNPAVYVWNMEVLFLDGTTKIIKGDVLLQR